MLEELLQRIATALDDACIGYMVIGGQAFLRWGEPRFTRDIDITLALAPDELSRLLSTIERAGLRPLPENVAEFVARTYVLPAEDIHGDGRVDFVFSWTPFERQAIARAVSIDVSGVPVQYATCEDLLIHKLFAGRARDLEDARVLINKQGAMDLAYVESILALLSEGGDTDFVARLRALRQNQQ